MTYKNGSDLLEMAEWAKFKYQQLMFENDAHFCVSHLANNEMSKTRMGKSCETLMRFLQDLPVSTSWLADF